MVTRPSAVAANIRVSPLQLAEFDFWRYREDDRRRPDGLTTRISASHHVPRTRWTPASQCFRLHCEEGWYDAAHRNRPGLQHRAGPIPSGKRQCPARYCSAGSPPDDFESPIVFVSATGSFAAQQRFLHSQRIAVANCSSWKRWSKCADALQLLEPGDVVESPARRVYRRAAVRHRERGAAYASNILDFIGRTAGQTTGFARSQHAGDQIYRIAHQPQQRHSST